MTQASLSIWGFLLYSFIGMSMCSVLASGVKKEKKNWHGHRRCLLGKCKNIIMVIQTAVIFPDKDTCTFSLFKQFDSRITHPAFLLLTTMKSLMSAEIVWWLVKSQTKHCPPSLFYELKNKQTTTKKTIFFEYVINGGGSMSNMPLSKIMLAVGSCIFVYLFKSVFTEPQPRYWGTQACKKV